MTQSDALAPAGTGNPYLETIGGEAGKYGPETRLQLLRLLADGQMLGAACKALGVPRGAPYWWGESDPRYRAALAHAQKAGASYLAGETLSLADGCDGTREDFNRVRLQVEARRWLAGRIDPDRWSEKQQHAVTVHDRRRTAFVSFLGERPIVEVEASQAQVDQNASTDALQAGLEAGGTDASSAPDDDQGS